MTAPVRDARAQPGVTPGRATQVHVTAEEWTRRALFLLEARRGPFLPGVDAEGPAVVWELLPGKLLVGCEHPGDEQDAPGAPDAPSTPSRRWTVRLDEVAVSSREHVTRGPGREAALVTVEVGAGRRILVDLLAAGVTTLSGPSEECARFIASIADELESRRWSPLSRLVLVGVQRHRATVPRADTVIDASVRDLDELLAPRRPSSRHRRWDPATAHGPNRRSTLVVIGEVPAEDVGRVDQLVARVASVGHRSAGGGLVDDGTTGASLPWGDERLAMIVSVPWPGARCTLAVGAGGLQADVFLRALPTRPALARSETVMSSRECLPKRDVTTVIGHTAEIDAAATPVAHGEPPREAEAPREAEVAVLGRVEVRGVDGALGRHPKLTELVVYLALHPAGASSNSWSTALWPGRRVPPQTIANRLSEARRLLGFAPDGRPRLRRDGERHVLADVSTDWSRFQALARNDQGTASWRAALALVRGRPFEDLESGLWTALECTGVEIERAVTECALRCGAQLLEENDPEGAAWSAHQGLRCAPWDERLHRLLMITADATGNRAGVEATLRHLALVLEVDGDPLCHVHPETVALYEQLHGNARHSPPPPATSSVDLDAVRR